jgi:hypothetical protein
MTSYDVLWARKEALVDENDRLRAKLATAREALENALDRDGCRCDTSVCYWCRTDGWVQVHPYSVKKIRDALKEIAKTDVHDNRRL